MGATSGKKRTSYSDCEYDEEAELRNFEIEIGGIRKCLHHVMSKICIETDIIPVTSLEDHIRKDFSENFVQLIRQEYFYKNVNGENYYDARKINLLLFMLTNNTTINNGKMSYNDKASFIFTFVKTKEDQNMCEALEENEENLILFIQELVDIACVGIVDCYNKLKNIQRDGYLNKLRTVKEHVVKQILKDLFSVQKTSKAGALSFEDLNKKFSNDKYFFTSGMIREYGWNCMLKTKGKEEEEQRKAEEEEKKR